MTLDIPEGDFINPEITPIPPPPPPPIEEEE